MVHSTSNILHHSRCTKNFSINNQQTITVGHDLDSLSKIYHNWLLNKTCAQINHSALNRIYLYHPDQQIRKELNCFFANFMISITKIFIFISINVRPKESLCMIKKTPIQYFSAFYIFCFLLKFCLT